MRVYLYLSIAKLSVEVAEFPHEQTTKGIDSTHLVNQNILCQRVTAGCKHVESMKAHLLTEVIELNFLDIPPRRKRRT